MKNLLSVIFKLFRPPVWIGISLSIISTGSLIAIFVKGQDTSLFAYLVYLLSFYTLVVICIACINFLHIWYSSIKQKIYDNKFGRRYMTDAVFKTRILLYKAFCINLLYVAANIFFGFLYRTAWFFIIAGYYIVLAVMRFLLLKYVYENSIGENRSSELKLSRLCAVILLMINIAVADAVLMIIYMDKGYSYNGILIYIVAIYTFYITVYSVVEIIKYRKHNSPVLSSAKVIDLSAALVSMLWLETAMFLNFGTDESEVFRETMIVSTGAVVSMVMIIMSVYIIAKSSKEIKNNFLRSEE